MTTTVQTTLPTPNHKRAVVFIQHRSTQEDGSIKWLPEKPDHETILEHGQTFTNHVHTGARIVIEERD